MSLLLAIEACDVILVLFVLVGTVTIVVTINIGKRYTGTIVIVVSTATHWILPVCQAAVCISDRLGVVVGPCKIIILKIGDESSVSVTVSMQDEPIGPLHFKYTCSLCIGYVAPIILVCNVVQTPLVWLVGTSTM